jgi:energy-coupling factor transport system permease protein
LVPTIISVIRGTGVFAMALESKGFGYDAGRTYYLDIAITAKDIRLMLSTSILFILFIGIKIFLVA